jgi:hypothetical protein
MPGPLYPLQPVFARGELSPRLFSRVDIDHYKMGLAECVNWLVMKQGGLRRRPGTEWINFSKTLGHKIRLVRFVFSTLQAYVLEFGDHYVRFYANGGILSKSTEVGITFSITPTNTVNWTAHGLAVNDPVQFSTNGVLPAPLMLGTTYYVKTVVDANHFQISATPGGAAINMTAAGSGAFAGLSAIELATPYGIADIWKLQFAQSADVLYIAHPNFQQQMLSRFTGSLFSLIPYTGFDGPYLPENTTPTTMAPSATAGIITVTASGITGINGNTGFHASDVGRWVSVKYSNKWYGIRITAYTSTTQVQGDVVGHIDDKGNQVYIPDGAGPTAGCGWARGRRSPVIRAASRSTSSGWSGRGPTPSRRRCG